MRRKIGHQYPSTGPDHPSGFADCGLRVVQKMQHLMKHDSIKPFLCAAVGERQPVNISTPNLAIEDSRIGKTIARDRQHFGAAVDADAPSDMG